MLNENLTGNRREIHGNVWTCAHMVALIVLALIIEIEAHWGHINDIEGTGLFHDFHNFHDFSFHVKTASIIV